MAERKTYTYTPYTPSKEVTDVGDKKTSAENAYNTYLTTGYNTSNLDKEKTNKTNAENAYNAYYNKGFTYDRDAQLQNVMTQIYGRQPFSYDLDGDALYQQYKDKYIQQGRMAMQDTMGQAAAMTGGYGNSYAATAGNQAYQASLQQLNDIVPELYQLALDRYNMEEQSLYNKYGMLSSDRNTQYGMWSDEGNRLGADRGYYSTEYDNAFTRDYGMWADKGDMLNNDRTYYGTEYNNAYTRDFNEHTTKEGYKYQNVADANSFALAQSKVTTGNTTPTLSAKEYDEVLQNAAVYANPKNGGGKVALQNYLKGMMARGLSESEAINIYAQYFPADKVPDPPKKNFDTSGGGGGGARPMTYHTLN